MHTLRPQVCLHSSSAFRYCTCMLHVLVLCRGASVARATIRGFSSSQLTLKLVASPTSGFCGTKGSDTWNVVMDSEAQCRALCCAHRELCAAYIYYKSYKETCCTGTGCTGNITTPASPPGAPCCWLKSAVGPAHLWSNDPYCSAVGVVSIPGPL